MSVHELGALLMIGFGSVGLYALYAIGEGVVRWILNGDQAGEPR